MEEGDTGFQDQRHRERDDKSEIIDFTSEDSKKGNKTKRRKGAEEQELKEAETVVTAPSLNDKRFIAEQGMRPHYLGQFTSYITPTPFLIYLHHQQGSHNRIPSPDRKPFTSSTNSALLLFLSLSTSSKLTPKQTSLTLSASSTQMHCSSHATSATSSNPDQLPLHRQNQSLLLDTSS